MVEKLKSKPVAAGRYDIVVDPTQLFLAIHESCGHSTELDRALGYEANSAGTSFIKPTDAGKLRFGANIVNLVGDRTQPGGLATTGYDDEGVKAEQLAHRARRHVRRLADHARAGAAGRPDRSRTAACTADSWSSVPFPRMPNVSLQPATTEVTLDDLFSGIKRGLFVEGRGVSSIDQQRYNFQFGGGVIREITRRQARRDGQGRGLPVAHAGLLGVVRRHRRPGNLSTLGHVGRRQGRTRTDQRRSVMAARPHASATSRSSTRRRSDMLNRDDALKICETVLDHAKAAGADDAQVSLDNSVESHARFADNRITTSGRSDDVDITATVWVGAAARRRHRQRHRAPRP